MMKHMLYVLVLAGIGSYSIAQNSSMTQDVLSSRMNFVTFCDAVHEGNLKVVKQLVEQENSDFSGNTLIGPDRLPAREIAQHLGYEDLVAYFDTHSKN